MGPEGPRRTQGDTGGHWERMDDTGDSMATREDTGGELQSHHVSRGWHIPWGGRLGPFLGENRFPP